MRKYNVVIRTLAAPFKNGINLYLTNVLALSSFFHQTDEEEEKKQIVFETLFL